MRPTASLVLLFLGWGLAAMACGPTAPDPSAKNPSPAAADVAGMADVAGVAEDSGGPAPPAVSAGRATLGPLEVSGARASLYPGSGVVYMTIRNRSELGDRLRSVTSPLVARVETHESRSDEAGVVRMEAHPDGFDIPGNGSLVMEEGGKHVMLLEARIAAEDERLPLVLEFEIAGSLTLEVPIVSRVGLGHHPGEPAHEPDEIDPVPDGADPGELEGAEQ